MRSGEKPIEFRGGSLADLKAFPDAARQDAGYQLGKVQAGDEPSDWKPMNGVGAGVREIRVRDVSGAFRVVCVAKFDDVIYVLHCFQKKTRKTSPRDLTLAKSRYQDLVEERSRGERTI